jgi:CHASE3 domain sensor protein
MSTPAPAETPADTTLESPAIHRTMRRAVVFPFLTVLLLCGLLGWQVRALLHEYGWVTHTEHVLAQINLTQRLLVDHETALRAHLLVGEAEFLRPFREAERELPAVFADLERATQDNAAQAVRVVELRRQYTTWKSLADAALAAGAACEPQARTRLLAAMRERTAAMDAMRELVAAMTAEERALMQDREARVTRADRFVTVGGAALGLLLAAALIVVFRRWLVQLDRAYRRILDQRIASEERERQARTAAEALAADILAQSRALEVRFTELRAELARVRGGS